MVCKACGKTILWVQTKRGKQMPCDWRPVPFRPATGGKARVVSPEGDVIAAEICEGGEPGVQWGYTPHWATCPAADRFRK